MEDKDDPQLVRASNGKIMGGQMNLESTTNTNETADLAKKRIRRQPNLTFQRIWCEYDVGRLFLRGQVPTFYHKQLAQEAIAGMAGVVQVVNEIEVVW